MPKHDPPGRHGERTKAAIAEQRIAENAPRWPDVKLVMARRIRNGSQTQGGTIR